ncbi:MAG: viperin family antiviral radical SAM protein [Ignavibacteria bacterium]|nr:viperin family antiviral radical SAM protein [Ignavibacteria bacterium]
MIYQPTIRSVNWHIISKCNYNCQFCYTKNLGDEIAKPETVKKILTVLRNYGIEKVNFVGGEPMLHPNIFDFCNIAKDLGFTVCITSNGSYLNLQNIPILSEYVDWIGISVDSSSEIVEKTLGRGTGNHICHAIAIAEILHEYGISLKINTTVTRKNYQENLKNIIDILHPSRWKVFQLLHIIGQNDNCMKNLGISCNEFSRFIDNHKHIRLWNGVHPVFERAEDMINAYFMLAQNGDFIINKDRKYHHYPFDFKNPESIISLLDSKKYYDRGAIYSWG